MGELDTVAASVDDGSVVAFGGKTLHRPPVAFVRELVRQGTTDLTLVGVANSMDVDLLAGTGRVSAAHYGYVGYEGLGLAPNFRRAVEAGTLDPKEGTCYTVATMLRGAKQNVPFVPVAGFQGSELPSVRDEDFREIECPFTGEPVFAVRTVTPDVAVVHATEADESGNARFYGADLTENVLAKAADRVIVTTERLVDSDAFADSPERTNIPGVLVDEVVEVPYGAHPCSCPGEYDYDVAHIQAYLERSREGRLDDYLETYLGDSEAAYRDAAVGDRATDLEWDAARAEGRV
ncbi:MAG: CoA transferase subunit A [Haloarculaceae archaeon]